tara:strand:- start:2546 stop:3631 length:1086 start_codon:yes stop_codon:yes gene_type:complete
MTDPGETLLAIIVGLIVILFVGTATHGGLARACKRQLARYTLWRLDSKRSVHLDTEVVSNWALLHDELRFKIIFSLSLEAKLALGNTCRAMRRLCNSPPLWRTVCFSSENAHRLTDEQLHRVLLRVNAKQHTAHISLRGCTALKGVGLEPLSFSSTLESIDLRVSTAARGLRTRAAGDDAALDPSHVKPILESMMPMAYSPLEAAYRLDRIHLNSLRRKPRGAESEPERAKHKQWIALMRWASAAREQRDQVLCGHCGNACDDTGPLGVLACSGCGVVTCKRRQGDASSDEADGGHAHAHSHGPISRPTPCPSAFECDLCRQIFCATCDAGAECAWCGTIVCIPCATAHPTCLCTTTEGLL